MMKKIISIVLVIIISTSNITMADTSEDLTKDLDDFINYLVENQGFNGNVLIEKNNQVLLKKSYGYRDIDGKISLDVEDKFLIGSVTKEFLTLSILQLEEKGFLKMDEKISKYFPAYKYGELISIENLLVHNSGLKDMVNRNNILSNTSSLSLKDEDIYLNVMEEELNFKPGEKYQYSNTNYYLLSLILEKVTKNSLENYLIENIFLPLEMKNTGVLKSNLTGINISPNPVLINLNIKDEISLVEKVKGAGYMYSTLDDLYKWDRALYTEQLLSRKSLDKMLNPIVRIGNNLNGAYGFRIKEDKLYGRRVYQTGNTLGFTSGFNRYVDQDMTIIVLTNIGEYDINSFLVPVERIIFKRDLSYGKNFNIDTRVLGTYRVFPAMKFDIYKKDGKAYFKFENFKETALFPVDQNQLSMKNTKIRLKFTEKDNIITSVKIWPYNIVGIKYK